MSKRFLFACGIEVKAGDRFRGVEVKTLEGTPEQFSISVELELAFTTLVHTIENAQTLTAERFREVIVKELVESPIAKGDIKSPERAVMPARAMLTINFPTGWSVEQQGVLIQQMAAVATVAGCGVNM